MSHNWGREIGRFGHRVRLISPDYVKPFVKRGKSDAHDARAICEAASRPDMRFVRVKNEEQQAALMQHTSLLLLIDQRTAVANSLRGQLAEFGVIENQGIENLAELLPVNPTTSSRKIFGLRREGEASRPKSLRQRQAPFRSKISLCTRLHRSLCRAVRLRPA